MEVGQQLSEARQRRNLSLADISRTTKIPVHLLEAIERNDIDHLPQGFFTRAFVRTYATEVGVNPDEVLDSIEHPEIEQVEIEPPTANVAVEEPSSSRSLFFVLALAGSCAAYFGFARTPVPQAPDVASTAQLADVAKVASSSVPPATSDVVFDIQSHGGCIVAVTADGRPVSSQLPLDERLTVKARGEIILRVTDTSHCAPSATVDRTMHASRRVPAYVPVTDVVTAGGSAKPNPATRVPATEQAVESAPAPESPPRIPDVPISSPDQPAATAVEQF